MTPQAVERIRALRRRADYRSARSAAQQAFDAGEDLAEVSAELGRLQEEFGDYDAAEASLRAGLQATEQVPAGPPRDRLRAILLAMLVRVHRSQGRYTDAHSVADDALLVAQTGFSPGDPTGCEPLIEVGRLRQDLEDIHGAEQVFRRAEQIVEEAPEGPGRSAGQAMTFGALGGLERVRGRYALAEPLLRQALELGETAFGPNSLEVANILNDLGIVFKFSGRFNDAKPLYVRALNIIRDAVGPDAPDLASIYHNLGGLEHARGDYVAAEPYAHTSIRIREKALGADHIAVAADKAAYASIIDRLGRGDEAEVYFRQALAVFETVYGPEHIEIAVNLNNLAAVLQRRGDLAEAEALYRRSLHIKENGLGVEHPAVANTLNNLAIICKRQDKLAEAESLFRRALAVLQAGVEPNHPSMRTTLRNYARLLNLLGRAQEAAALTARADQLATPPPPVQGLSAVEGDRH